VIVRGKRFGGIATLVLLALVLIIAHPTAAYAWTPGTHVFLGEAVIRSLTLVPEPIADLLRAFPHEFLYGSIAADTSIAKKYAPAGRHCHSWTVGFDILNGATDDSLRAFAFGYLAHLAADSVAHNFFVPKQLAITSSTSALGHSYWESRFETHLGDGHSRTARDLILLDHSPADALLDRILSPTIFSTPTNRRIFRGMVVVADSESWQRIFQVMMENSRWDLGEHDVGLYVDRSFDFIVDLLRRMDASEPFLLDPSGDRQLRLAKRVRRSVLRSAGEDLLREEAEQHFGLPATRLAFARQLALPLFVPPSGAER